MRPRWNDAREVVLTCPVRVDVRLDQQSLCACIDEKGDQFWHFAPEFVVGDLEVNHVNWNPRTTADFNRLRDRFENSATFGAKVSRIDSPVLASDFAHRDQRVGIDPDAWRPAQRAGYSE